jgi:hypothetical protein
VQWQCCGGGREVGEWIEGVEEEEEEEEEEEDTLTCNNLVCQFDRSIYRTAAA